MIWKKAEADEKTAIVSMHYQHNPDSIRDLSAALDEILIDGTIRTVIFTSAHAKNWHIGIDLAWMMEEYRAENRHSVIEAASFINKNVFRKVLTMPAVTIAAINGHAYANGVVFACMNDIRYMKKDRGYFCLNEIENGLGDAFLPSVLVLFRTRFDPYIMEVMIPTAKKMTAPELERYGIIDRACDDENDLMRTALARARQFSSDDDLFARYL
ncbi:MAG TPA: enoyl-CoA hydratase/isomerase family protein, partial [Spirochaetota bacterium]|nr:enoyl-CoA hydratase/isomerase family protein [Spirochaetota bacterium]